MLLRFKIAITETTKTCPTAVLFSLHIPSVKTQKDVWTNSSCVVFPMYLRSVHQSVAPKHWKCSTNGICPTVFVCFASTHVERKQNRRWTIPRCLGNCNIKTQHHLDNFQMLTHTQPGQPGLPGLPGLLTLLAHQLASQRTTQRTSKRDS